MLDTSSILVLLIVSIIALQCWGVAAYLKWFRKFQLPSTHDRPFPKAAIILAIRGAAPTLNECLTRLAAQNYPEYEIHLVVDHPTDPANQIIENWLATAPPRPASIQYLKDPSPKAYLKTSAVLQAVQQLDANVGIAVLADADTLAHPDWLKQLAVPLLYEKVGLVTGNRWYDPTVQSWGALCRFIYNAICVAPMYFITATWGGSLAIRRDVFETEFFRAKMTDTPCEDAAMQATARHLSLGLETQPDVMMFNTEPCTMRSAFDFIKRQLLWTRLYHRSWYLLLAALLGIYLLLVGMFLSGIYCLATGSFLVGMKLLAGIGVQILAGVLLAELLHRNIAWRIRQAQGLELPAMTWLVRWRMLFALPMAFLMMSYAMLAAQFSRFVTWSGITYRIVPDGPTKRIPPGGLRMMNYAPLADVVRKTNPLIPPLRDNRFLVDLITETTRRSRDEVIFRFKQEHRNIGWNVRQALAESGVKPYEWSDAMARFYEQTDAFLYETVVWNRTSLKNEMRAWIGDYFSKHSQQPLQILSFGDGLGFDAYYLAERGHKVTYFDVSQPCQTFARRLFERGNLDVTMLTDPEQLLPESYDAILCLDVLEHVPQPSELVGWLSNLLRPGGELIVHAPFHYVAPSVQTHLRANLQFSGDMKSLYEPHGLKIVAGELFWNPIVLKKVRPSEAPTPTPWQVRIGSLLLGAARAWNWPHNFASSKLINKRELVEMMQADETL